MVLKADDLWPLVEKLTREEQLRLVRRALACSGPSDATAYERRPVAPDEFSSADEEDPLSWESEGWDALP